MTKGTGSSKSPTPKAQPMSAVTGRFVTKPYAEKHPNTTFTPSKKK